MPFQRSRFKDLISQTTISARGEQKPEGMGKKRNNQSGWETRYLDCQELSGLFRMPDLKVPKTKTKHNRKQADEQLKQNLKNTLLKVQYSSISHKVT